MLNSYTAAQVIAHLTPDDVSCRRVQHRGLPLLMFLRGPAPHPSAAHRRLDRLGLPLAVGAALAAPGRKVVCPHGDGGAAYTMQALWTMAREKLDITT